MLHNYQERGLSRRAVLHLLWQLPLAKLLANIVEPALADPVEDRYIRENTNNPEAISWPELVEVDSIADLESLFRESDSNILGEGKSIYDFSEEQIRIKRQEHGLADGNFKTQIVISRAMYDSIVERGLEIGTDNPVVFLMAHHVLWQELCEKNGLPSNDVITRVIVINDPSFISTQMQRMRSEGNLDAGPWRTHYVNSDSNLSFHEPLDSDQLTIYPIQFALDNYPFKVSWHEFVMFEYAGVDYMVRIDSGAIHEWFGHTKGKNKTAGCLPDHYWYNRGDFETSIESVNINTSITNPLWDPDSFMNLMGFWEVGTELSGNDVFLIQYRGVLTEKYGGIHADGIHSINWPDGDTSQLIAKNHHAGYDFTFVDRTDENVTNEVAGDGMGILYWGGNSVPAETKQQRFSDDRTTVLVDIDEENIHSSNYIMPLDKDDTPIIMVPRPILSLFAIANAENYAQRALIKIHLNTTQEKIISDEYDQEYGIDYGKMYIKTFIGKINSNIIENNPLIHAWTEVNMPATQTGEDTITIVWTTDRIYSFDPLEDLLHYYLPIVFNQESSNIIDEKPLRFNYLDSRVSKPVDVAIKSKIHSNIFSDERRAEYLEMMGVTINQ